LSVRTRRSRIIEILRLKNIISLKELAGILDVSEMTLYRDLKELSENLLLSKGNVIYRDSIDVEESPYYTRKLNNTELKTAIARSSIDFIDNNDTIFLDGSSTIGYLANELTKSSLHLTVVTISPVITTELCKKESIKILCPGGMLDPINMIYYSDIDPFLGTININKAFISCGAFSLDKGFTDMTKGEFDIKKKVAEKVPEINILVDHTKMGRSYSYTWCNIDDITRIIIDDRISKENLGGLRSKDLEIVLGEVEIF
jgi:DeoR/GlpR family transcriptional regulator of sugar metabolism